MVKNNNSYKQGPNRDHSKPKFNPDKYGKLWNGIDFKLAKGMKAQRPTPPAEQPLIGSLCIGGKEFEITASEASRIMDTLKDAQYQYNNARRLGMLDAGTGTPVSQWSKTYE